MRGPKAPPLPIARRRDSFTALALATLLFAGCAATGDAGREATTQLQPSPGKAEDFMIVDCLLPGQIRRLGAQVTFLTARRAIKTSARDCEIRGGEYVAFDRSNYATALKIWLPLAKEGDASAQTYVGEIFEKGLGVPPDHAAAADWYRRAAESGYSRAAINLGHLYEQGLGVPKDPPQALTWYRRAAGLGNLSFTIAPVETSAEVQQLRTEVGELRRQLETKQGELDRTQRELDSLRQRLDQRQGDVQAERGTLARLRQDLEASRTSEQATAVRLRELQAGIAERETRLAAKDRELGDLRASVTGSEAEAATKRAELDRLQRERAAETARAQREVEDLRKRLAERGGEAAAERDALTRLRQDLEAARGKEQTQAARLREIEQAIAEREARLAARDGDLAALRASLSRSEAEAAARRAEAERLERQRAAELDRSQREAEALRKSLAERGSEAAAERGALGRLRQDLETSRKSEQAASVKIRELEASVTQGETRLAAKDRDLAELRASLARSEADSTALRADLTRIRQRTAEAGPDIQLIEPELVITRGTRAARAPAADRLVVVGRVNASDGLLSLTVNGLEEKLGSDNLFKSQVGLTRSVDERVRIVAIDRRGRKSTLEFLILSSPETQMAATGAAAPARVGSPLAQKDVALGTYHALVIGNNDYKILRRLRTAVNDAREVARILERDYGFKVTLLLNATRYDTLSALNAMRERLTEKDNLLIYYAGHGELDKVNQRGHWLPVDAEPNSSANWISNIAITDVLNAMTVRQLLVVADSCFSGTLTRSSLGQLEGGLSEGDRAKLMQLMAQKRSRMAMSSGGVEPVLDSVGGPHSVFAQSFIELLRNNSGVLLGQEMFRHLQLRVAAVAQQRVDDPQVPEYAPIKFAGHESGDFLFVRASN